MPVAMPETLRDTAKCLFLQGVRTEVIAVQLSVRPGLIRNWASRYGWVLAASESRIIKKRVGEMSRQATDGAKLRESFAKTLEIHAAALEQVKGKPSISRIKAVGEALEPLVRSAKIVHSWGSEAPGGLVLGDLLGLERASHDISASVTPGITPQELPACGSDTPTDSVPDSDPVTEIPQVAEEPTPQIDAV